MVVARTAVSVLAGENDRREGTFPAHDTLGSVVAALFGAELQARRRVRLIYGGRVRELGARLVDIVPESAGTRGGATGAITLHAVIGAPGSLDDAGDADPGSGGAGPTRAPPPRGNATVGDDTFDVVGVKVRPQTVLITLTGALILLLAYAQFALPRFASAASAFLTLGAAAAWAALAGRTALGMVIPAANAAGRRTRAADG